MSSPLPEASAEFANDYYDRFVTYHKKNRYSFSWTIHSFSDWLAEAGEAQQNSPLFPAESTAEYQWNLYLIPMKKINNENFISLFLRFEKSPSETVYVKSKIVMQTNSGVEIKQMNNKNGQVYKKGHGYGYSEFISHDMLLASLPDNILVISCTIEITAGTITEADHVMVHNLPRYDLGNDMASLLDGAKYGDTTVLVGDRKFLVYKGILAARSSVFDAMFSHQMLENVQNTVTITDMDATVFKELLAYIYTDKIPNLSKFSYELFAVADKYGMVPLRTTCEQAILANLSVENAAQTLQLADMHQATKLKARVMQFIGGFGSQGVTETDGWKNMAKTHPHLISEAFKAVASKTSSSNVQVQKTDQVIREPIPASPFLNLRQTR